jgi:hypothetical protein
MRPLDVSHRPGVIIQPGIAKDGVPAEPDQLVDNYKNPNRNMINLRVHKAFRLSRRRNSDCKPIHPSRFPSHESPPQ